MRPLIVGMANPHSADPQYALYPFPPTSAGMRLYRMMREHAETTVTSYVRAFARVNLVQGEWDRATGLEEAAKILTSLEGSGRRVVLLGEEVRRCFGVPRPAMVGQVVRERGCEFYPVPHPSGRCRVYNDPRVARAVGRLLASLYEEARRNDGR